MAEAEDAAVDARRGRCASGSARSRRGSPSGARRARGRRGSSASSGSTRRSRSATGCPSRSAGPAAGTCSARTARRPSQTTWDAVAEVDPEMLFLMPCGFHLARDRRRNGRGRRGPPGIGELPAVRRGQVFAVDGSAYFSRPGPRVIDGIELLAEIFDPDGVRRHRPARSAGRRSTRPWLDRAVPRDVRLPVVRRRAHVPRPRRPRGLGPALPGLRRQGRRQRVPALPAAPGADASGTAAASAAAPAPRRRDGRPRRDRRERRRRDHARGRRPTSTARWSPTTRPAPPSTTTGTCAAAATRAAPIHDAAWNAELDAAGRWLDGLPIARRDRRARRRHRLVVAAARRRRASCRSTTRPRRRSIAPASGWSPTGCAPTSTSATPGPSRIAPVDALFAGFWLSHVAARPARGVPRARPPLAQAGRPLRVHRFAARPGVGRRGPPDPRRRRAVRRLDDGREFTIVKVFYAPDGARGRPARGGLRGRRGHHDGPVLRARHRDGDPLDPGTRRRRRPVARRYTPRRCPPSSKATIATVGSGVMAEAMIAGLLRGELVAPGPGRRQPSAPRAARGARARVRHPDRGRQRGSGRGRRRDPARASSPRCSTGSAARSARTCAAASSSCSVLAGATTAALTGILGHDQVVRSMPNTPARLGKGMTVWYATPETTEDAARPGGGAARCPRRTSSRSTTRRWSRWPPRSAAPARPTSSSSWRRSSMRPSTSASRATSPTTS